MEKLIRDTLKLRDKCVDYSKEINLLESNGNNFSSGFFNMALNHLTQEAELLSYYFDIWGKEHTATVEEINRKKNENGQRVIMCTKSTFIHVFSLLEFSLKKLLIDTGNKDFEKYIGKREKILDTFDKDIDSISNDEAVVILKKFRNKIRSMPPFDSVMAIFEKAKKLNYISESCLEKLRFITEVRNNTVHNNNYASKDIEYPDNSLKAKKDVMMNNNLNFFLILNNDLLEISRNIFIGLVQKNNFA